MDDRDDELVVLVELQPCGRILAAKVRLGQIVTLAWSESPDSDCPHAHTGVGILVDHLGNSHSPPEDTLPPASNQKQSV